MKHETIYKEDIDANRYYVIYDPENEKFISHKDDNICVVNGMDTFRILLNDLQWGDSHNPTGIAGWIIPTAISRLQMDDVFGVNDLSLVECKIKCDKETHFYTAVHPDFSREPIPVDVYHYVRSGEAELAGCEGNEDI